MNLKALWAEFRPGRTIYVPGSTGESPALAPAAHHPRLQLPFCINLLQ